MTKLDVLKLKEIANANPTAERVFTAWALMQRTRRQPVRVSRFKKTLKLMGEEINEKDFYQVFFALNDKGFGVTTKNRVGHPYTFAGKLPVRELGRLAVEAKAPRVVPAKWPAKRLTTVAKKAAVPAPKKAAPNLALVPPAPKVDCTKVAYIINGKTYSFEFPGDVSPKTISHVIEASMEEVVPRAKAQ